MKVDESFRDLKGLLGLGEVMNKRQGYLEKVIALVLLAYGLGLLLGEEIRDRAYAGKRRWQFFSGLFVLLRQLGQVSSEIVRAAIAHVTALLHEPPLAPVPTHA